MLLSLVKVQHLQHYLLKLLPRILKHILPSFVMTAFFKYFLKKQLESNMQLGWFISPPSTDFHIVYTILEENLFSLKLCVEKNPCQMWREKPKLYWSSSKKIHMKKLRHVACWNGVESSAYWRMLSKGDKKVRAHPSSTPSLRWMWMMLVSHPSMNANRQRAYGA